MMWLKRIEQHKRGQDERTFECPRCLYSESFVVELVRALLGGFLIGLLSIAETSDVWPPR